MPAKNSFDRAQAREFLWRVVEDVGAAFRGCLCYVGDRLGIFRALADCGPVTVEQLAQKTGLQPRYLREWLSAMAAARYIDYDAGSACYTLPAEHAGPLARENSPVFLGGFFEMLPSLVTAAPKVAEAFRHGGGVPQDDYPLEMAEAMERVSAKLFRHQLVQKWLPLMPNVKERLEAGGLVLDVGCGGGLAAIALAQAFPRIRVRGLDRHSASIERARSNADAAGLSSRVTFAVSETTPSAATGSSTGTEEHRGANEAEIEEKYDLACAFDVVHDAADPVRLMTAVRRALATDGTFLIQEANASGRMEENITPAGRLLYCLSTLYCLTTSLAEGGPGLGTMMGEPKARELAAQAGFGHFRRLPFDDPFIALYELRAG